MNTKRAFTLIELVISITIIVILTMVSYAPYNYYQNKAKLKVTTREVSQLLYESRNMAVNWVVWTLWNMSIWVYFDTSVSWNNQIKVFSYPHDIIHLDITYLEWWDVKLIKTLVLKKWIQIDDIESMDNLLFVFDAITWDLKYYNWIWWSRNIIVENNISINFSYKGSSSPNLNRTINYFTNTNIIDY